MFKFLKSKRVLSILTIVVAIAAIGLPAQAATVSDPAVSGEVYKLVNPNSGKVLDIAGAGTSDGTNVRILTYNGQSGQHWKIIANGDGTYKLLAANSGKALDVAGAGTANGTNVQIWTDNGTGAQKWTIASNTDGTVRIVNPNSGKVLDVAGGGTADGTNVQIYSDAGSAGQKWKLVNLSAPEAHNLALNKAATASTGWASSNTFDGNIGTRWSSDHADNQWIYVDLGSSQPVNRVVLKWEAAYAASYKIQTSNNATSWTDAYSTTLGSGGTEEISFPAVNARYVRMLGLTRATIYGFSLWEMEVYPYAGPDLTGYSLFRDYSFGSKRNVNNLTALSNSFKPYGVAGTTVINNEWQRYQTFNSTNHQLTSNALELTAVANLGGIYDGGISSGQIVTKETFYPRNGKTYMFQVRAKIPTGAGTWPAFWMYSPGGAGSTTSEIDIFEYFNSPTQNTGDWTGFDHGTGVGSDYHSIMTNQWVWHPGFDFSTNFHTFTLIWSEGNIQKWVDNTLVKGTNFTWYGPDPEVLINLAMGGSPNSPPSSGATPFPSKFVIDYFRVYQK